MKAQKIASLFILVMSILACERNPKVAAGQFETTLKEVASNGHYTYTLSLLKGEGFTDNVTLEVLPGNAIGNLQINDIEYTQPVTISTDATIKYLPFSAGDHKIEIRATGQGETRSQFIQISGVTPLSKNEIILPYHAREFDPELLGMATAQYTSADENIVSVTNNKLYWHGDGTTWIYATLNRIRTGCKVTTDIYRALKGLVVEVNGVISTPDNLYVFWQETADEKVSIKIIGLIPENASNFNPYISHVDLPNGGAPFKQLKNKTFTGKFSTLHVAVNESAHFPPQTFAVLKYGGYRVEITTEVDKKNEFPNFDIIYLAKGEKKQISAVATPDWEPIKWIAWGQGLIVSQDGIIEWDENQERPVGRLEVRIRDEKYGCSYDMVDIVVKK